LTLLKEVSQFKRVLVDKVVEVDFSEMLYKKSRLDASREEALARRHLRPSPGDDADARQPEDRANVSVATGELGRILPFPARANAQRGRDGAEVSDSNRP